MRPLAARFRLRTLLRACALLAVVLLLAGCLLPPTPETKEAKDTFGLYLLVFIMGAIVFVGVEAWIVYSVIRYRRRDDRLPTQLHGNTIIELIWTAIPTVIVLVLFVVSTMTLGAIDQTSKNPTVTIEVTGFQWQWTFRYLDTDTNPNNDYTVTGTAAEPPVMGLPVGQPIHLILHSADVIHSFFVPHFLIKRDVIPFPAGEAPNTLNFTITSAGTYAGQCAEFCGDLHARMTFSVLAMAPDKYQQWLADAKAGRTPPPTGSAAPGTTVVDLSAQELAFSTDEIDVAAGRPFVIRFNNKEALAHNVAIYDGSGKELFKGEIVTGPKTVQYQVPALQPGTYTFLCDVHPTVMVGKLVAK
jgi:cytochrome c oxidase subunit 2